MSALEKKSKLKPKKTKEEKKIKAKINYFFDPYQDTLMHDSAKFMKFSLEKQR